MHLKNFSLIENEPGSRQYGLSAAYDLLPVNVILPEDTEETALTMNGKKRHLHKSDFLKFALNCGIPEKAALNMIRMVLDHQEQYLTMCEESFLSAEMKEQFCDLIKKRTEVLNGRNL